MSDVLEKLKKQLNEDEYILSSLRCSLRTFVYRIVCKPGIIVATNKRLIFYGLSLMEIDFIESYDYKNITSAQKQKSLLKESLIFYNNGEAIKLTDILSENIEEFLEVLNSKIKNKK